MNYSDLTKMWVPKSATRVICPTTHDACMTQRLYQFKRKTSIKRKHIAASWSYEIWVELSNCFEIWELPQQQHLLIAEWYHHFQYPISCLRVFTRFVSKTSSLSYSGLYCGCSVYGLKCCEVHLAKSISQSVTSKTLSLDLAAITRTLILASAHLCQANAAHLKIGYL